MLRVSSMRYPPFKFLTHALFCFPSHFFLHLSSTASSCLRPISYFLCYDLLPPLSRSYDARPRGPMYTTHPTAPRARSRRAALVAVCSLLLSHHHQYPLCSSSHLGFLISRAARPAHTPFPRYRRPPPPSPLLVDVSNISAPLFPLPTFHVVSCYHYFSFFSINLSPSHLYNHHPTHHGPYRSDPTAFHQLVCLDRSRISSTYNPKNYNIQIVDSFLLSFVDLLSLLS